MLSLDGTTAFSPVGVIHIMDIRSCDDFPFASFSLAFAPENESVDFSGKIEPKEP